MLIFLMLIEIPSWSTGYSHSALTPSGSVNLEVRLAQPLLGWRGNARPAFQDIALSFFGFKNFLLA